MNKSDLIDAMAASTGLTKKAVSDCLEAFMDAVKSGLMKGKRVTLTGFMTAEVVKRKARTGRNPQTGATIQIPAKNVVKFKAGKALKDSVA